jgi:hypothetical protein
VAKSPNVSILRHPRSGKNKLECFVRDKKFYLSLIFASNARTYPSGTTGATTLSMTTLSITTLSKMSLLATLSINYSQNSSIESYYAEANTLSVAFNCYAAWGGAIS